MKIEIVNLILTTDDKEWFNMDVPIPYDVVEKGNNAMEKWVINTLTDFIETH